MVRWVHAARDSQHGAKLVGIPSIRRGCTTALLARQAPRREAVLRRKRKATLPGRRKPAWRRSPEPLLRSYFAGTTRLFFTENTLGTPLARRPAMFLSVSLSATPSSVTLPFLTMM